GEIAPDGNQQAGLVEWTPEKPGVYVLQANLSETGGPLRFTDKTFIKVTPGLSSHRIRALLIGQKKYSLPIAHMLEAMGIDLEVIDESSIHQLAMLRDPGAIHEKYDVVWLASFDSLWKLLDPGDADGLKQAIKRGVGFIHSGGPGSFHGGSIQAALLSFTSLDEALPVATQNRDDLFLSQSILGAGGVTPNHAHVQEIRLAPGGDSMWDAAAWSGYELDGFNRVRVKPESKQVLAIMSSPLLVTGHYGQGRTVAFMGFTPEYVETVASWNSDLVFPYMLDQEFAANPRTCLYFTLFMKMIVAATGKEPSVPYAEILSARVKPLFETLKNQLPAALQLPKTIEARAAEGKAVASFSISNKSNSYARLVRARAKWSSAEKQSPFLVMYSDNYFDLMPGETRELSLEFRLSEGANQPAHGYLIVEGSNVADAQVPIVLT
ncbi:MAG: glutamine amidotransferase, partial [Acidobacteriaceae bacterium]